MSQLHNQIRSGKGKKAEIVIFPGTRHEYGFSQKNELQPGAHCRTGEGPAE